MKTLHISVVNKIATYRQKDGDIVCGNSDYQICFAFDDEWLEHRNKTARFEWNDTYTDVEFTGDTCAVPIITNATSCHVGVYVGEIAAGESPILSTTNTVIPCRPSLRCGDPTASDGTGENYTNEARGYAEKAESSAKDALEAADGIYSILDTAVFFEVKPTWAQGGISASVNGQESTATNRVKSDYIDFSFFWMAEVQTSGYQIVWHTYDKDKKYIKGSASWTTKIERKDITSAVADEIKFVRILVRKQDDTALTPSFVTSSNIVAINASTFFVDQRGMQKVGELVVTVVEEEVDGMYETCLGGQPLGDDGVVVLRRVKSNADVVSSAFDGAILNLFRNAKIVEVKIDPEGLDPNDVMSEDNFGVEVGFGGLIYCGNLEDYDEFPGMNTPDERLAVYYYDNPNNPSAGYGSYFLKLNSAHARAIRSLALDGTVKLIFTAYK